MRKSNIELLRIISMVMIILHHLALFTKLAFDNTLLYVNLLLLGKLGTIIFVIITGYFQIEKEFKTKRVISIWLQTLFYSIILEIIFTALIPEKNFKFINLFPILTNRYWFIGAYLILYMFSPFINKIMRSVPKNVIEKAIIVILIIFVISTFSLIYSDLGFFFVFVSAYIIGAYIRLYEIEKIKSKKKSEILFYIIAIWIIQLFVQIISEKTNNNIIFMAGEYSIFNLALAVLIFYYFKNIDMKNSKIINFISKNTLAVFLFHEHTNVRYILWCKIFANIGTQNTFVNIIFAIISIWCVSILIEVIRNALGKIIMPKVLRTNIEKIYEKVDNYFKIYKIEGKTKENDDYKIERVKI